MSTKLQQVHIAQVTGLAMENLLIIVIMKRLVGALLWSLYHHLTPLNPLLLAL